MQKQPKTESSAALPKRKRVECPKCGYRMPIEYDESAQCKGVHVKCKGRECGCEFEIILDK